MDIPGAEGSHAYFEPRNGYYHAYDTVTYKADKEVATEREQAWALTKQMYKDLEKQKDEFKHLKWDECKPSSDENIVKYTNPVREAQEELKRASNAWAMTCNSAAMSAVKVAELRFQAMQHPDMVWYQPGSEKTHKNQIQARLDNAAHLTDHARLQMKPFAFLQPYRDSMPTWFAKPSEALLGYLRGQTVDHNRIDLTEPWWSEEERIGYVEKGISPQDQRMAERKAKYDRMKEVVGTHVSEEEVSMYMDLADRIVTNPRTLSCDDTGN